MKAVVAAFNQEKALVGAFSVITNLRMELFEALGAGPGQASTCGKVADKRRLQTRARWPSLDANSGDYQVLDKD